MEFLVAERERERESCSWLYKGCEFALNKRGDAEDDAVSGAHRLLLAADRLRVVSVGFSTQPLLIRPLSLSASRLTGSPPLSEMGAFRRARVAQPRLSGLSDQNAVLVLPNLFRFTQAACMAQPSKVLRVCVCVCVCCIVLSYCHYGVIKRNTGKGKRKGKRSIAVTATHMPYGIAQCCLPPGRSDIPALTPAELN